MLDIDHEGPAVYDERVQSPPRFHAALALLVCFTAGALVTGCEELTDDADGGPGAMPESDARPTGPGCGLATEPEPNDTSGEAAPYFVGTSAVGCLAHADDVDVYEIKAPAVDLAGGYFQASLTDVGAGTVAVEVASARDNAAFLRGTFTNTPAASLFFFWAAAPGETYRIAVSRFSSASGPFRFTLRANYTRLPDPFEPNDDRNAAKALSLGVVHEALFFAGHQTESVAATDFSDWYSVTLASGPVSVKLQGVPTTVRPEVELFDASNTSVSAAAMYNNTPGGDLATGATVRAGAHRLVVRIFALAPDTAGKVTTLPDNFMRPYRLTVSQP